MELTGRLLDLNKVTGSLFKGSSPRSSHETNSARDELLTGNSFLNVKSSFKPKQNQQPSSVIQLKVPSSM